VAGVWREVAITLSWPIQEILPVFNLILFWSSHGNRPPRHL
jgi:hypothetical protein